jgi:type I restriction enzyme, R subunit
VRVDEEGFEEHICGWLVENGGYQQVKVGSTSGDFDAARGLDLVELFAFVEETQPEAWAARLKLSGDVVMARTQYADRVARELDARGTVDVLRHGVVDLGVRFRLAFFKPAHGLTPSLVERYEQNRLTLTRQLPFGAGTTKTLDVALFVNGVPVATAELKNRLTGQSFEDAKEQYRTDRNPKCVTLSRRAVVHFAVDSEEVAMTTRLAGKSTRFLPFNRGHQLGAGNPPNPDGYRTAYLWERVWSRDAWMDLLARFVHVEKPAKGSRARPTVIFPRFHQWAAVVCLEQDAREHGAGEKYLVQHSAGSGKSNTIAWLAHRLSSLHQGDVKVFDKVVVITDRVVLDRQLQDTIYQFEHAHGVVERIDTNSSQLAAALSGEQARIIITTLQKFPYVLDKIEDLPERRYAVIIDEAHSSQTGEAAKEMKRVLGGGKAASTSTLQLAAEETGGYESVQPDEVAELLAANVEARGRQSNLSFFAFTATPKGKTLELLGSLNPATGKHEPFHLYSMRQAIEEAFIHDVLANYVTYETYWKIEKAVTDDPEYDTAKARTAIARYVTLHEHNLMQKANVVLEHFRAHVAKRIGGQAKAMVVTSSIEHAIRFYEALKKVNDQYGNGLGILVAFSGTKDIDGQPLSEAKLNGFPESQTAAKFNTDGYRIMVVAEKFQTGFDQPKLYAMYVDKTLTGLAAVQTLSRLNRTMANKTGTFVLDFRNDADQIREAFAPWYTQTVAPPTDPNLLWDTRHALDEFGILDIREAAAVARLLEGEKVAATHERVHAVLTPAVDRFRALEPDEQDAFRDALNRFVRTYSFLSQIVELATEDLERDYLYGKALLAFIRDTSRGGGVDLGTEVELTHLRTEKTFQGSVALDPETGEVQTVFSGSGKQRDADKSPLSQIIDTLNERFGLKLTDADRLHVEGIFTDLIADSGIQQAAAANSPKNFAEHVLPKAFQDKAVGRLSAAEELTYAMLDNAELMQSILGAYGPDAYEKAKVAHQQHCPIGDLLGPPPKEGPYLEYKATFRTHTQGEQTGEVFKPLETASLKTIAAFLNSRPGGTLLIGVNDDGTVHGLESDYATLRRAGKDDADVFLLHLNQAVTNAVGQAAAANVTSEILTIDGRDLCRVHVRPSKFPVEATVTHVKNGQHEKKTQMFARFGNATKPITDPDEADRFKLQIWG